MIPRICQSGEQGQYLSEEREAPSTSWYSIGFTEQWRTLLSSGVFVKTAHLLGIVLKAPKVQRSQLQGMDLRDLRHDRDWSSAPLEDPGGLGMGVQAPQSLFSALLCTPWVVWPLLCLRGGKGLLCVCWEKRWRRKKRQDIICYVAWSVCLGGHSLLPLGPSFCFLSLSSLPFFLPPFF